MKSAAPLFFIAGVLLVGGVRANQAEHVQVSQAWLRVLPGGLPAGAYLTLTNSSDQPAALRGASSASYAQVMLHKSSTAGGTSSMAAVSSLSVPAHGSATLAPAGYHLMLMNAVHPVKSGDTVKMSLQFADGSTLGADFMARPANAMDAGR